MMKLASLSSSLSRQSFPSTLLNQASSKYSFKPSPIIRNLNPNPNPHPKKQPFSSKPPREPDSPDTILIRTLTEAMEESPKAAALLAKHLSPSALAELESARKLIPAFANYDASNPIAPNRRALIFTMIGSGVPFIGFGIMDNSIMILAGDQIDASLGVLFGLSTLCAAAIGNIISDIAGVMGGTFIEGWCEKLGLPDPNLSRAQRKLRNVRWAGQLGCAIGITVGCLIGMFPLLWIDNKKTLKSKKQEAFDQIFTDAVAEVKSLIGAEATTLFIVQDIDEKEPEKGKELYSKYVGGVESSHMKEVHIPIGTGIAGRVALTGEVLVLYDVRSEPDFDSRFDCQDFVMKNMICVPVRDPKGNVIAVVQGINKVSHGRQSERRLTRVKEGTKLAPGKVHGFTNRDVQILQSLSAHISLALQSLDFEEDASQGLIDTIRLLRETGGKSGTMANTLPMGFRQTRPLHKE